MEYTSYKSNQTKSRQIAEPDPRMDFESSDFDNPSDSPGDTQVESLLQDSNCAVVALVCAKRSAQLKAEMI